MGIFRRLSSTEEITPFQITISVTAGQTFTLPLADYAGLAPNFVVSWGDGNNDTITSSLQAERTHTYASGGIYTISILGFMPAFAVNNNSAIRTKITSLVSFGNVGLRKVDFYGCSLVTSIPSPGTGLADMENFTNFMRSTGITTIPSGLFDLSVNATTFTDAFSFNSGITSIPTGLFDNCTNVTIFSSTFNACVNLVTVPSTLFDQNVNVVNFSSCFRNCRSVTAPLQFTFNTAVTTFANLYNMGTTVNAMTGTAPTLWSRIPEPYGFAAFRNCINLSNYASIPSNWK
jgi:hypothetical protein